MTRIVHDLAALPAEIRARTHVYTDKADWLAHRRTRITGSDMAAILGLGKYRGPWDVWMDKCHPQPPEDDKPIWRRGRFLETAVMEYVRVEQSEPGHVLWTPHPDEWIIVDGGPGLERFAASPDGITINATTRAPHHPCVTRCGRIGAPGTTDTDGVCTECGRPWPAGGALHGEECKSVGYGAKDDWMPGGDFSLPVWIQMQSRLYSMVLGIPWRVHAFVMPETFATVEIPRSADIEAHMVEKAAAWWDAHVTGNSAPSMDGSSTARDYLLANYERQDGETRDAAPDEVEQAVAYRRALDAEKAAKEAKQTARNRLLDSMAGVPRLTLDGRPLVSVSSNGRISVKDIA